MSIEWEGNKKHSTKSCMALVDEMAMAAWNGLKLGETVFAHDTPIMPMPLRRARAPQIYSFDADALIGLSPSNRIVIVD